MCVEFDIIVLSSPHTLATSGEPVDILLKCTKQPARLIRTLTIGVNVRIGSRWAAPQKSFQALTSAEMWRRSPAPHVLVTTPAKALVRPEKGATIPRVAPSNDLDPFNGFGQTKRRGVRS